MELKTFITFLLLLRVSVDAEDILSASPAMPCVNDEFCKRYLPEAKSIKCHRNQCMCVNPTNEEYESCPSKEVIAITKAIQKVGSIIKPEACKGDEDCAWLAGSSCVAGEDQKACKCPDKYTKSSNGVRCEKIVYKLNGTCTDSAQCEAELGLSECVNGTIRRILGLVKTDTQVCACKPGAHFSKNFRKCVTTRNIGELCSDGPLDECYALNKNYACKLGVCVEEAAGSGGTRKLINVSLVIAIVGSIFMSNLM